MEKESYKLGMESDLSIAGCGDILDINFQTIQFNEDARRNEREIFDKQKEMLQKAHGIISRSLEMMPTLRNKLISHDDVVAGNRNGFITWRTLCILLNNGPITEAQLVQRIRNQIDNYVLPANDELKDVPIQIAVDAIESLDAKLPEHLKRSEFDKVQKLISLSPHRIEYIHSLQAHGREYIEIVQNLISMETSIRDAKRKEDNKVAQMSIQKQGILKVAEETRNDSIKSANFSIRIRFSDKKNSESDNESNASISSNGSYRHHSKRKFHRRSNSAERTFKNTKHNQSSTN